MNDIITKVIKMNKDILTNFITDDLKYCIDYDEFTEELKYADVIPVN